MNILSKIPNWAVGLTITVLFLVLATAGFFRGLELKSYDMRVKLFAPTISSEQTAIVAIDPQSIASLGRWPWPRHRLATIINKLNEAGAKVIGFNILLTEPEESTGLTALRELKGDFVGAGLNKAAGGSDFYRKLSNMERDLDNDNKLRKAIKSAGNVVVPLGFTFPAPGAARTKEKKPSTPDYIRHNATTLIPSDEPDPAFRTYVPLSATGIIYPIPQIGEFSAAAGHLNKLTMEDGIDRSEVLAIEYDGNVYPSFAMAVASRYLGLSGADITADLTEGGGGIEMSDVFIETGGTMQILINFFDPASDPFPVHSFFDVINDKVNASAFKDKIVLIGITDLGQGDKGPTPLSPNFTGVERAATVIENLTSNVMITKPVWSGAATYALILAFGLITTLLLVKTPAKVSAGVSFLIFVGFLGWGFYMFSSEGTWVEVTAPALLIVVNYMAVTSMNFWFSEEARERAEMEGGEANKLLGLTFQSKGMLEMAFEKFKKMPVDKEMMDVLYTLGLEFEKKRNWAQAQAVYERILAADKKFKDIPDRMTRLGSYTGGGAPVNLKGDSATIMQDGAELPTLGRYEVMRELGRGAMGVVYLGKDPKINREVAIKTINFDEMEEKMVPVLKERFFREAQSAGTLNHPNIMTIFDVGEEGNLAYIAIELIDGRDLEDWAKKENLLPKKDALSVVAKVAGALDFAHTNGIVHRDIKPANIMVTKKGTIKVTDFGIARIQSSSATKTGTVMGTPSYMSPEQVAGQKVDGRADIFSLGVVLFELLTAERPFTGDSIATLMYAITNAAPKKMKEYDPDIPDFCQALVDKAIQKDPAKRFQKAGEFAGAIKWCLKKYGNQL